MERRRLGRTKHDSSVAVLGAATFADCTPEQAAKTFDQAFRAGINHVDVAPTYGEAERNLGPLLPERRDALFVAGKSHRSDPDGVRAQIGESLATLQIDQFDLYQLHGVTSVDQLDERKAAVEAMFEARDAGLTRFVGITGHGLETAAAQLEAIRRWDLDTVMFPLNPRLWSEPDYRRDVNALLVECRTRNIGVQTVHVAIRGPWGAGARTERTSYRPYTDPDRLKAAVDFVLSIGGVQCLVTPGDRSLVAPVLAAATKPTFLSDRKRRAIVADFAGDTLIVPSDLSDDLGDDTA